MRKGLAILAMAFLAAPLFADVELSTSINDVFYRGTNELAGSITMRVQDDDFSDASTSEPVYIRVTLDHEARLAQTLVNLTSNDGTVNDPIYLAMRLNRQGLQQVLVADRMSVSVVRWVKGESALWIRVQTSSRDWITDAGNPVPPQSELTVSWTFGTSARLSHETYADLDPNVRNLPFNTRDVLTAQSGADTEDAVSTLICVNLSTSSLTTSGVESLLNFDPIAFDETSDPTDSNDEDDPDYGFFITGSNTGINFTNDFAIARGKNRECSVEIGEKGAFGVQDICIPRSGLNASIDGWLKMTNTITYVIDCRRGGDFLDTAFINGAYVTLGTGGRGLYGFRRNGAEFTDYSSFTIENDDTTFIDHDNGDNTDEERMWREIDVVYNGIQERSLDDFDLEVEACVYYHYENGPVNVDLDWSITLVNHDGAVDDEDTDFDGPDQHRRCLPSEFTIDSGLWEFGAFVECTGRPVSIFFPYLPKLRGNDLFWSGLVVVNQGWTDLDVEASLYDEMGNRFTAEFPSLVQGGQYTWLLIEDEDGTAAFMPMTDGDYEPIVPEPDDASVDPASFGETRLSMFVRGTFSATYNDEVANGDLDGYLLIGKDTDIDGSYLPRNYDNNISGQNADLPLRRSKNAGKGTFVNHDGLGDMQTAKYQFANGRWINKPSSN
jgi:hypothetical protein